MKKVFLIAAAFIVLGFTFKTEAKPAYHGDFGFFYSSLSPHGTWIEIEAGLVAWRPAFVKRTWAPYSRGYWIWTVDGWYWESYEPFGYITYHYGRWHYDDYYGWIWLPDYEWAPAWVEWRYNDDYIGWAPLSPYALFSINIGIHFTHTYQTPYSHWHFVKYNHFCDPYVYKHYVGPKYKYGIHQKTKYRTNYSYDNGRVVHRGVDVDYVRQRTRQEITPRNIKRYTDVNEFERDRNSTNRERNEIRTLVASRDQISRGNVENVEIKRSERKTTLETSKIQIGRRERENTRLSNTDEKATVRDRNTTNDNVREKGNIREEIRTKDNQVIERNNLRVDENLNKRKVEERKETNNDNRNIEKKVNIPERKTERQVERKIERKDVDGQQKKTEVRTNTQQERKTEVKENTRERKVERQNTSGNQRNSTDQRSGQRRQR